MWEIFIRKKPLSKRRQMTPLQSGRTTHGRWPQTSAERLCSWFPESTGVALPLVGHQKVEHFDCFVYEVGSSRAVFSQMPGACCSNLTWTQKPPRTLERLIIQFSPELMKNAVLTSQTTRNSQKLFEMQIQCVESLRTTAQSRDSSGSNSQDSSLTRPFSPS